MKKIRKNQAPQRTQRTQSGWDISKINYVLDYNLFFNLYTLFILKDKKHIETINDILLESVLSMQLCGCGLVAMTGASQRPFCMQKAKKGETASNPGSNPGSRIQLRGLYTECHSLPHCKFI